MNWHFRPRREPEPTCGEHRGNVSLRTGAPWAHKRIGRVRTHETSGKESGGVASGNDGPANRRAGDVAGGKRHDRGERSARGARDLPLALRWFDLGWTPSPIWRSCEGSPP